MTTNQQGHDIPKRRPSKQDVEFRRVERRAQIWMRLATGLAVSVVVTCSAIPLLVVVWIVRALAGQTTKVELAIGFSIVIGGSAFSAVLTWLVNRRKISKQSEELIRLRERCRYYEQLIDQRKGYTQ